MTDLGRSLQNTDTPGVRSVLDRIALLRQKLYDLYQERGRTDDDVLALSVELDEALNELQKMISPTR